MSESQIRLLIYSGVLLIGVLISSVSQILLKMSARKQYPSKLNEYLNPYVIVGYGLVFGCTVLLMFALKVVPLSMAPVLEASGYVFVSVLGFIFLKEKLNVKQVIGMVLIIVGILIYSLL